MQPTQYKAGYYLRGTVQLHVPQYQRPYSWGEDRHADLWRDVLSQYRRAVATPTQSHFMGALIVEQAASLPGGVQSFNVVDGQQRLLTLAVLVSAIRDHIAFQGASLVPKDNELSLIKPTYAPAVVRFVPKAQDSAALAAILEGGFVDSIDDSLFGHPLAGAYRFFRYQIWLGENANSKSGATTPPKPAQGANALPRGSFDPWGQAASGNKSFDLVRLDAILATELSLLELQIDANDEEAGVIFETMNAKQTPLAQFDLVRNSLFVRMPSKKSTFYASEFAPVEKLLAGVTYSAKRAQGSEQFLYEYLISVGVDGVNKQNLHRRWLNRVIEDIGYQVTPSAEIDFESRHASPLVENAWLYPLAVGQESSVHPPGKSAISLSKVVHSTIAEIMAMSGGPAVPLLLKALHDRQNGHLTDAELAQCVDDVQSYMVRHVLSGLGLNIFRGLFTGIAEKLTSPLSLADLRAELYSAGWKSDSEVLTAVMSVDLKGLEKAIFPILRGIERQLSGVSAHPMSPYGRGSSEWQVEHIFPQTANIGAWTKDLQQWNVTREDMDSRRYTLGNLTAVTGFDNKKNGKRPFGQKKKLVADTASLKLHDSFKSLNTWKPSQIDSRTAMLAQAALLRWPRY